MYRVFRATNALLPQKQRVALSRFLSYPAHVVVPMPALSPTMEAGSIAKWLKKEGEKFEPGQAICEVETDKATVTFDATEEGYVAKILVGTGEIKVGQPIFIQVEELDNVKAFSDYKVAATVAAESKPIESKPVESKSISTVIPPTPVTPKVDESTSTSDNSTVTKPAKIENEIKGQNNHIGGLYSIPYNTNVVKGALYSKLMMDQASYVSKYGRQGVKVVIPSTKK